MVKKSTPSDQPTSTITVLVVDDHPIARHGICELIAPHSDLKVIGEAGDGIEALQMAKKIHPDVVTMDVQMPNCDGVDAVQKFQRYLPKIKIVVLSAFFHGYFPKHFIQSKVQAYVTKDCSSEELAEAIRLAHQDKPFFSHDVAQMIAMQNITGQPESIFSLLSKHELQIAMQFVKGYSNQKIASLHHISKKTVTSHRINIFKKLNIHSNVELLRLAIREGLVEANT
jgi:two-component system, NarL family, invasion response regulator UvrY